jgi:hypothetical protein
MWHEFVDKRCFHQQTLNLVSVNVIYLLYPQTPNNVIDISLTYGVAPMNLNIQGVVAIVL